MKFFSVLIVTFLALFVYASAPANAQMYRGQRAEVEVGIGVQHQTGIYAEREEGYAERGPCKHGAIFEDGECVRKWTAAELSRIMPMHKDNDPNCGPGMSGKIYTTLETGRDGIERTIRHRCR